VHDDVVPPAAVLRPAEVEVIAQNVEEAHLVQRLGQRQPPPIDFNPVRSQCAFSGAGVSGLDHTWIILPGVPPGLIGPAPILPSQ
jgi:hypothetical protein